MIGRSRHEFPQEAFAVPFKTVLLPELQRALVAKRLYNRIPREPVRKKVRPPWGSDRFVWARRQRHPLVRKAISWAAAEIRSDLQTGLLTAYMPTETAGIFHKIHPQFWYEIRGIRIDGMLFDVAKNTLVPDDINEDTLCVFEECAWEWLTKRQIGESNPAFPATLRKSASPDESKVSRKRPSRIKKWCVSAGIEILTERGGLSPNFRQTHLIQQIYKCRPKHWADEEPSEASMKRYAREAIKQFAVSKR